MRPYLFYLSWKLPIPTSQVRPLWECEGGLLFHSNCSQSPLMVHAHQLACSGQSPLPQSVHARAAMHVQQQQVVGSKAYRLSRNPSTLRFLSSFSRKASSARAASVHSTDAQQQQQQQQHYKEVALKPDARSERTGLGDHAGMGGCIHAQYDQ